MVRPGELRERWRARGLMSPRARRSPSHRFTNSHIHHLPRSPEMVTSIDHLVLDAHRGRQSNAIRIVRWLEEALSSEHR